MTSPSVLFIGFIGAIFDFTLTADETARIDRLKA